MKDLDLSFGEEVIDQYVPKPRYEELEADVETEMNELKDVSRFELRDSTIYEGQSAVFENQDVHNNSWQTDQDP